MQAQPKQASFLGEAVKPQQHFGSLDDVEIWSGDIDSFLDDRGRQRKYMESAKQRQERHEFVHRAQRRERNHIQCDSYQPRKPTTHYSALPSTTMKEWELRYIEGRIPVAAASSDAPSKLCDLLCRVQSLQSDEPRIMGMCTRLSKIIQSYLQVVKCEADRQEPFIWIEDVVVEGRRTEAIERIRRALLGHRAHVEVSEIMRSVISVKVEEGKLTPSSLLASLSRIEDILGDAKLTRFLRLHINARIVHRLFNTALAQSSSVSFSKPSPFAAGRMEPLRITTSAGKPKPVTTFDRRLIVPLTSSSQTRKQFGIVKPFVDSDSEGYEDIELEDSLKNVDDYSSESSSPQTPLDSNFLRQGSPQFRTIGVPKRYSMSVTIPSFERHLPSLTEESDIYSDDSDYSYDERLREEAREETLKKLCRESEWAKSVRDAEPVMFVKRQTRISVIPSLLTVGEDDEEDS